MNAQKFNAAIKNNDIYEGFKFSINVSDSQRSIIKKTLKWLSDDFIFMSII